MNGVGWRSEEQERLDRLQSALSSRYSREKGRDTGQKQRGKRSSEHWRDAAPSDALRDFLTT